MSKFIVIANQVSARRENTFTKRLGKLRDVEWWHYFPSSWLVADRGRQLSKMKLAELAEQALRTELMVFELDDVPSWAGQFYGAALPVAWLDEHFRR